MTVEGLQLALVILIAVLPFFVGGAWLVGYWQGGQHVLKEFRRQSRA